MNLYNGDTDISPWIQLDRLLTLNWVSVKAPDNLSGFTFGDNKQGIMA